VVLQDLPVYKTIQLWQIHRNERWFRQYSISILSGGRMQQLETDHPTSQSRLRIPALHREEWELAGKKWKMHNQHLYLILRDEKLPIHNVVI